MKARRPQEGRPRFAAAREQELRESIELFFFGYRAFTALPDQLLARRGLSRVHHRVLYFVGRSPGISVSNLLAILGVSKQALNEPLRKLVGEGLIQSRSAPDDRRIRQLSLTAEGEALEMLLVSTQMVQLKRVFDEAGSEAEIRWRAVMKVLAESPLSSTARRDARRSIAPA